MKVLSKTDFIHYLRCPDSLWLEKNKPYKFNKELGERNEKLYIIKKIIASLWSTIVVVQMKYPANF